MKKISLLLLLSAFVMAGFSQDIVVGWTFDGLTGANSGASNTEKVIASNEDWGAGTLYADGTNGSDDLNNQANPEINAFGGTTLNDPRPTPSNSKDLAIVNTTANGKSVVFKFSMSGYQDLQLSYAQRGSTTGYKVNRWYYSTDGQNFTLLDSVEGTNVTTYTLREVSFATVTELNDAENVYIKLTVDGCTSGSGNNRLDNVVFRANINGPDIYPPKILSHSIENNTTVKLVFNEQIDQSIAEETENYSLEGIDITNATLDGTTVTLSLNPELIEGESYALYVTNIEDLAGNVMVPDTINFNYGVAQEFHVANIAALREKWTADLDIDGTHFGSDVYKLTGSVIVTGINDSYRHQIFIQDETGAIVIDDNNHLITTDLVVGDEIKDIYGTLTDYYGLLQFAVTEPYTAEAITIYNEVTPLTVTVSDMQDVDYMNAHQCELISMKGVTFNETGTFANGSKYTLTQNGVSGNGVWIHFYNMPGLTGEAIPTTPVDLLGVNKISYGAYYLIPRDASDVVTTGINDYIKESDVVISPNPVASQLNITLKNPDFKVTNIAVYDINGKFVASERIEDGNIQLGVGSLAAGQYFVRLSDGNKSVTTKFIKR